LLTDISNDSVLAAYAIQVVFSTAGTNTW